jgi:hypothetical protein
LSAMHLRVYARAPRSAGYATCRKLVLELHIRSA